MQPRIIRLKEACRYIGMSRASLYPHDDIKWWGKDGSILHDWANVFFANGE